MGAGWVDRWPRLAPEHTRGTPAPSGGSWRPPPRCGERAVVCLAQGERRHRGEAAAASLFRNHRSLYDMVLAHKEVVTNWEQVK